MWQDIGSALALLLILEGVLPFLYPNRWRRAVEQLSQVDNRTLRWIGFGSMLAGLTLLALTR